MYNSHLANDNDSIDFDFFENEGDQIKVYGVGQRHCSKIITKAVIESTPSEIKEPMTCWTFLENSKVKWNWDNKNQLQDCKTVSIGCFSSPTSLAQDLEIPNNQFDDALLNCLAYNDNINTNSCPSQLEDKESSDNSLSDSTLTSITSDFTSVSSIPSISGSSCTFDESVDPEQQYKNTVVLSNEENSNYQSNSEVLLNICSPTNDFEYIKNDSLDKNDETTQENEQETSESEDNSFKKGLNLESDDDDDFKNKNINAQQSESDYGSDSLNGGQSNQLSDEKSKTMSELEGELEDVTLSPQSRSTLCSIRTPLCRGSSKLRLRNKGCNLTFSREELIKIERDNLILLKKIMAHSKPTAVSLNHSFHHKKTSAAINRAKQQKKIEQDNYILYSKISAMGRMKKVF